MQDVKNEDMPTIPLAALLDCATEELGTVIMKIGKEYSLPPSLLDVALTPVVCKIKEMKASELSRVLADWRGKEDGNKG